MKQKKQDFGRSEGAPRDRALNWLLGVISLVGDRSHYLLIKLRNKNLPPYHYRGFLAYCQ
jgi:hypothetical protein